MISRKLHFKNGLTNEPFCATYAEIYKFTDDMKEFFDTPKEGRCKRCEQVII